MIKDDVLRLCRKRPFQPFRIVTVVGEVIDVWNPHLMFIVGNMLTVGQPHPDEPPPAASDVTWLNLEEIDRIVPLRTRWAMQYKLLTPDEIHF